MNKNIWLRTNELTEAVNGLEAFFVNIEWTKRNPRYWKWAIITLHNSVQGFMVCALRGTNNLTILKAESSKALLEAYDKGGKYPKEQLDEFMKLYKKIKGRYMNQFVNSQRFIPKGQQGRSIKKLNTLRNEFIHFVPKGLSLEISGLPKICIDVLNIIEFLATRSGNVRFYPKALEGKCLKFLAKSKSYLAKIDETYNGLDR